MSDLKKELAHLFSDYFGDSTAQLLEDYFDGGQEELVRVAERMMVDLMGDKRAHEQLNPILKKYNISI